jgi:hypothetical protein
VREAGVPDDLVPADRSQSRDAQLRVSDTDREQVAGQLREHAAARKAARELPRY